MIEPTVGRVVWYHPLPKHHVYKPHEEQDLHDFGPEPNTDAPRAAIITHVNTDKSINLHVLTPHGVGYGVRWVWLWQGDSDRPSTGRYAEWMPYQKGQAAKADALEAKLAGAAQGAVDGCVTPVSNPPLPDKLTDSDIERVILRERYISPEGWFQGESTLTVCILTLRNGYEVTGTSACVGPKNYDWTVGRKLARENAKNKVWELEGYLLKQKRWEQGL